MKTAVSLLCSLIINGLARSEEPPGKPEVYHVTRKEVVLLTAKDKPEERLALLFINFEGGSATYKWMYFNPLTSDWVTGTSRLQEVYDKVPVGEGLQVTVVPGHNTKIQAGRISVEWSRGGKDGGWLYYRPEHLTLESLPADQFYKLQ